MNLFAKHTAFSGSAIFEEMKRSGCSNKEYLGFYMIDFPGWGGG